MKRLLAAISSFLIVINVHAAEITPTSVTVSSTFGSYDKNNLINGAGLTGNLHSDEWTDMWMTDQTVTGELIFDLGAVYSLDSVDIWNYNATCCGFNRGVKELDIYSSIDNITYSLVSSVALTKESGGLIAAQMFDLVTNAQFIKFDILSNWGSNYTGLSEVRFNSVSEVPIPAAAFLFGPALLGFMGLRRKAKQA